MANSFVNNFEIPSWAGKPPPGLHLDVLKDGKMIQKLMIDEKKCYFFGRNKQLCDFCIDHASSSRVHAALVWHKHLNRPFIIDLGSTHGTFIGTIRLESKKPQQVPIDSQIHFGASTRIYIIRERPQNKQPLSLIGGDSKSMNDDVEGGLMGLPETESELDNLTEFNTAHNRRIAAMGGNIVDVVVPNLTAKRKRRNSHVQFKEEEEVINPEDIDPSIGRFRNMVQTTVIPKKKLRADGSVSGGAQSTLTESITRRLHSFPYTGAVHGLYDEGNLAAAAVDSAGNETVPSAYSIAAKLGLKLPNLAPDINELEVAPEVLAVPAHPVAGVGMEAGSSVGISAMPSEPKKKIYAKEAWPGKKPTAHSFLV
jgi:nuclear inhibitor of protein phosphatase 1